MTRLLEFLIALGLVLALFLIVGLVLPSKRQLVESVESNRRMTIVYDLLNNVQRLKDWNRLLPGDAAALSYSGGKDGTGTGARVDFAGGSWEITESTPPPEFGGPAKVAFAVTDERAGSDKKSTIDLIPTGMNNRNVKITQTYEVTYGFNLLGRFNGMYLASSVGAAMKSGLGKLSNLLATIPNVDYRTPGDTLTLPTIADVPAESILFVKAGNIDRTVDAIGGSIRSNREWINRVLASNDLEVAGPFRLVTTDYGQTKYAFDVAVPVRKKGTEGASAEELSVKVDGTPVEYLYKPAHKAVFASFTGDMKDLDGKRNALRAWALTNGYDVTDRPWDSWKAGLEKSFSEEGEFDIYWALKQ